jgi:transcriptional regulator with GAF, ATPase, and Fis domain
VNKEYPLIKKIEKIPIQTDKRHYVPKYLRHFLTEIANFYQKDQCYIYLFAKSTLLRGISLKRYKNHSIELYYVNSTPPWAENKKIKQDIIYIPDLTKLDPKDPLYPSIFDYFSHLMKSVLIIPIYYNKTNIGSIVLLTESKTHLFSTDEIEILKQASAHLTISLEKMIRQTMIDETKKILYLITEYHQLLKQDETQNKNPDIIAEVLLKVFTLKSVYILKKNGSRGNRWYQADIKENNEIESKTGTFSDSTFEFMLEEVKKDCPDFIDAPIKDNGAVIGKLFVDYAKRENDQPFKKEIYKILLGTADALAQLMVS